MVCEVEARAVPCQPLFVGGMERGEGALCADVSPLLSVNCYLKTIEKQSRSDEEGVC